MALQHYNHTAKLYAGGEVDLGNVKVMLLNDDAVFNAADDTLEEVAGALNVNEVAGNGWTIGGELLSTTALTVDTNAAVVDADDISVEATGGDIGPAYKALIYDATSGKPLSFDTFASPRTANEGTPFIVFIPTTGIFRIRPPA